MKEYDEENPSPWNAKKYEIQEISISGITKIGNYAFKGCSSVSGTLLIPETINSIRINAFKGITELEKVTYEWTSNPCQTNTQEKHNAFDSNSGLVVNVEIIYESIEFCWFQPITEKSCSSNNDLNSCRYKYIHDEYSLIINGEGEMKDYTLISAP